jgi:hypothetical protein
MDTRTLEVGETYFSVFYMDEELKIPVVETLVYLGADMADGPDGRQRAHLFQFAGSFHSDGNWNEMSDEERAEFPEPPVMAFGDSDCEYVVDAEGLIAELRKWQARSA